MTDGCRDRHGSIGHGIAPGRAPDKAAAIASGKGVRDWTRRDAALISAGMEELFRRLNMDRARR